MNKDYFKVKSPIVVIALMVGLSELGFGLFTTQIENVSELKMFMWAMIVLLYIVVLGFYFVLYFRPSNLYGPTDFSDPKDYLSLVGRLNEIEENYFVKFSKLEEPAIRLFLSAYYELKRPNNVNSRDERWLELVEQFSDKSLLNALDKLIEYEWLSRDKEPFELTKKGEKAHNILKNFIYGRLS